MLLVYAESGQAAFNKEKTQLTHEDPQYVPRRNPSEGGTDVSGAHGTSPLRPASHLDWATAETSVNEAAQRRRHPSTANSLY